MKTEITKITDDQALSIAQRLSPEDQNNRFQLVRRRSIKKVANYKLAKISKQQKDRDLQLEQFKPSTKTNNKPNKDRSHIMQRTLPHKKADKEFEPSVPTFPDNLIDKVDILSLALGDNIKPKDIKEKEKENIKNEQSGIIEHNGVTVDLLSMAL